MIWGVVFLLFCLSHTTFAQKDRYNIYGKVTWSRNDKPVEGVEVSIIYTPNTTTTDKNGEFVFKDMKPGDYSIRVFTFGYESVMNNVSVIDKDVEVNFEIDSLSQELEKVTVRGGRESSFGLTHLQSVEDAAIYAGKKTEVISMDRIAANEATDKSRQVFAGMAGVHVWESDGSGIQIDIGARGLSPKRSANFNTRQNGYDISADALGYPEAYYTPPTQALKRIEIVRGAASLQYGPQFGGLINFQMKEPPDNKKIAVESQQTFGSFGLFNSYNSLSGTAGDLSYFTYYQHKRGEGWRPNSDFKVHNAHASLQYDATDKFALTFDYSYLHSLAQQPGGLTYQQFQNDPRQSNRKRNWFRVRWNLAALEMNYDINDRLKLNMRNFGLIGGRDVLGFLGFINRGDPGEERTLLRDKYRNFGNETRLIWRYDLLGNPSSLLVGARYYQGFTNRRQGQGDDGSGPDFALLNPDEPHHSEYDFPSRNIALFAENKFSITPEFSITPGLRVEYIKTESDGFYRRELKDLAGNPIVQQKLDDSKSRQRRFALLGIGANYKHSPFLELYANFSQNYRGISFNDLRIVNPNLRVDENLKDERGYTADLGVRGQFRDIINYDVSAFLVRYNDRIGNVLKTDTSTYQTFRYRTNISDSRNIGLESLIEVNFLRIFPRISDNLRLSGFSNFSVMDGKYIDSKEAAFDGNEVELVPPVILKTGLTFQWKNVEANYQYSFTGEQYTDATNAEQTPNAVNGIIPSYHVMDASISYSYKFLKLTGGVNNLTDNMYFTRRASGYPGPGIIPAQGRSFYLTLALRMQ